MKKVVLSLAVLFAAAMVSCGNKANEATEEVATDSIATEEVVEAPADSTNVEAPVDSAANVEAPAEEAPAK
jgi:hypothetical protein